VLNDSSSGKLFRIIAGTDLAVAEGADVISMSIGTSEPADCSDPMATDRISAGSGVLLVLAAGDLDGPQETITSPGCAAVVATYLTATTASCPVGGRTRCDVCDI
jgi:subtilisin family serine protease